MVSVSVVTAVAVVAVSSGRLTAAVPFVRLGRCGVFSVVHLVVRLQRLFPFRTSPTDLDRESRGLDPLLVSEL